MTLEQLALHLLASAASLAIGSLVSRLRDRGRAAGVWMGRGT